MAGVSAQVAVLRRSGAAVVVFTADELGSVDPRRLEGLLVERGNEMIWEIRDQHGLRGCYDCGAEYRIGATHCPVCGACTDDCDGDDCTTDGDADSAEGN